MINDISTTSVVRTPRAIVKINDIPIKSVMAEVTTTTYYQADTFRIDFPIHGQLDPLGLPYFSAATVFVTKIFVGFPTDPDNFTEADLDLLIVGDADEIDIDPLTFTVTISGRDLTSRFIDHKTTQKFANKTASQIAILIANNRGLNPVVTPTTVPVGVYYAYDQALLTSEVPEWDLLTFLAQQEDFIVFVQGENLVFEPRPTEQKDPYVLQYQAPVDATNQPVSFNGMGIRFIRSTTITQDAIVRVRVPFNAKTKKAFTVQAKATHRARVDIKGLPNPTEKAQTYSYIIPGISKEQATQRAQQLLKDITIHEIKLEASLPGDNLLKKDSVIKVQGTNSAFDQVYFADNVKRTISIEEGYTMEVSAKNHSVDSQVTLG